MKTGVRIQLSVMMFLQYFIWGAWFVTLATYLGKTLSFQGDSIGAAYSTVNWAAIVSPFFIGMIADRFFSSQYVLGIMHLLGGAILYSASEITQPGPLFWVLIAYALCYMPTLALTNSIAFRQMDDPSKQFPLIRVLGTIGWIVAGIIVGKLGLDATSTPMQIAAGSSILMGLYSFTLPKTPPQSAGKRVTVSDILGLDSLKLLKNPSFAIFVVSSMLICIPLQFYYNFTNLFLTEVGVKEAAFKQTFGQMSEIAFMVVMPIFFVRLGVKWMLIVGMLAWAIRYALFAFGDSGDGAWMLYLGIVLHGICYDFFFVTGQIYVDQKAPAHLRASAQGFITLMTLGIGMLIGAYLSGLIVQKNQVMAGTEVTGHLWKTIWLIPAAMAGVVMVLFALLFRDRTEPIAAHAHVDALSERPDTLISEAP